MELNELNKLKETYEALKDTYKGDLAAQESLKSQYEGFESNTQGILDSVKATHTAMAHDMYPFFLVFGIILLVFAVFLIVAIIIQSNKSEKGLSGAITGGSSETFYGRNKGKDKNKVLAIITIVVAALFIVSVLTVYVFQYDLSELNNTIDSLDYDVLSFGWVIDSIEDDMEKITSQINSVGSVLDSLDTQIGQAGGSLVPDSLS
ncbi:MAG: preprotein translocase subunit SecG [Clostridia bacterium]|nr:preprotein translocase subunit SecG [Clostridia bacterium]